jgi:hypothetical protein
MSKRLDRVVYITPRYQSHGNGGLFLTDTRVPDQYMTTQDGEVIITRPVRNNVSLINLSRDESWHAKDGDNVTYELCMDTLRIQSVYLLTPNQQLIQASSPYPMGFTPTSEDLMKGYIRGGLKVPRHSPPTRYDGFVSVGVDMTVDCNEGILHWDPDVGHGFRLLAVDAIGEILVRSRSVFS